MKLPSATIDFDFTDEQLEKFNRLSADDIESIILDALTADPTLNGFMENGGAIGCTFRR